MKNKETQKLAARRLGIVNKKEKDNLEESNLIKNLFISFFAFLPKEEKSRSTQILIILFLTISFSIFCVLFTPIQSQYAIIAFLIYSLLSFMAICFCMLIFKNIKMKLKR